MKRLTIKYDTKIWNLLASNITLNLSNYISQVKIIENINLDNNYYSKDQIYRLITI